MLRSCAIVMDPASNSNSNYNPQPDDSSIKPVSSLRSRFENLSAPPSAVSRPQPSTTPLASSSRPNISTYATLTSPDAAPAPASTSSETFATERPTIVAPKPKKRPPTPPQPRKPTPKIQSPAPQPDLSSLHSSSQSLDVSKWSLPTQRPLTPSGVSSDAPHARPSAHSRSPSSPHLSNVENQGSSSLRALDVARPYSPRISSLPYLPPQKAAKPPPPVNRSAKPNLQTKDSLGPPPPSDQTQVAKLSPFNTPPSSSEDSPPDSPPPLPLHSKPKSTNVTHHPLPIKPSQSGQTNHAKVSEGSDEIPPTLPPRHQITSSNSQESIGTATVKRSALNQGFANKGLPMPTTRQSEKPLIATPRTLTPSPRPPSEGRHTPQLHKYQQSPTLAPELDDGHLLAASSLSSSSEYPDSSSANRRPPFFAEGPRMISTGYDLRLFALSGEYLCATGASTKVWNTLTGKLMLNMMHGEGMKINSLAFKPVAKVEEEGTRIWLGTNWGDILEVDIPSKKVVDSNSDAHHRREVVRIIRHDFDMWTLDDEGKLFVWPADVSKTPSLSTALSNGRVGRRPTVALAVGEELWVAFGKDIRIYRPDVHAENAQSLNLQSLSQPGAGDVTCATTMTNQPDLIYFGHSDGKISIYSRKSRACVELVSVSASKVSTLAGIGEYLWAGNSLGTNYVYDISAHPWKIKKDWRVHDGAVIGITTDRSNVWKNDRFMVVSLGLDNVAYLWDGMLRDDWLENDMLDHGSEYSRFRELDSLVVTWNTGAAKPSDLRYDEEDSNFFREMIEDAGTPDILTFGLQELVDLEDKTLTAKSFFKSKHKDHYGQEHLSSVYRAWRDYLTACLDEAMPMDQPYVLLQTTSLVGLFTCIFVKASLKSKIKDVQVAEVKTGMGGLHGNKGAIVVRFIVEDSSICFVNCHLAAGQTKTTERNSDLIAILESVPLAPTSRPSHAEGIFVHGGDGSMIVDNEICILSGDLNYRIDSMTRDAVITTIKAGNFNKLLDRDQLLLSRRKNPGFRLRAFQEMPLTFNPTYKYNVGTDIYDTSEKRRPPAWCDRILSRGRAQQLDYQRHEVKLSDHRPVSANFKFTIKTIDRDKRDESLRQSQQRFEQFKKSVGTETKLEYLQMTFGLSEQEARKELGI